jgi:phosphoenolpyruvate carboxylase
VTNNRVPIERLRNDVRFLGQLLGDTLVEQAGPDILALVERVRSEAISARDRGEPVNQTLVNTVTGLSYEQMAALVRAFTLYFYLVNAAEENYRLWSLRQRMLANPARLRPESIAATIEALREMGITRDALQAFLRRLKIRPVLTAHPSEARRRTILQHLQQVSRLIAELDRTQDREKVLEELAEVATQLWQTDELRVSRPTPLDEIRTGLFIFDRTLFDVVPQIYRDLERALTRFYPGEPFQIPAFLKFSTWIGGDRDGNPAVTNQVTLEALALQRETVLRRYRADVADLSQSMSSSVRRVGVSAALLDLIAREAEQLGNRGQQILGEYPVEPYRQMLGLIDERLRLTEENLVGGYASVDELLTQLDEIANSLCEHRGQRIAAGAFADLRWRVRVFGFHLAEMEIREHSSRHAEALAEILAATGVCANYLSLSSEEQTKLLMREIINPRPLIPSELRFSPGTVRVVELFRTIRLAQERFGADAIRRYVVSMTHSPADVLAVVLLAKEAGLLDLREGRSPQASIQVVPLFEGIEDLSESPETLRALFTIGPYRRLVTATGDVQEIMLGYSDSNKDGGYLAANVQLYEAQEPLADACTEFGVQIELFQGRGGAIGRGGGPMGRAIAAMSPRALNARLKYTEQGEVIFTRYGNPGIAHRHLEQVVYWTMMAGLAPQHPAATGEQFALWQATLKDLAERSLLAYRVLIDQTPGFERYFREATPFPEIAQHAIASRPVSRSTSGQLADVRAIPWGFSWTQCRVNLPGWYGVGSGVESYLSAHPNNQGLLAAMYQGWPVFRSIVDNCQVSLATADMAVARLYRDAVADRALAQRIFTLIVDEYERSRRAVVAITGQRVLLGESSILLQSIRLRNPYVDPLNVVQATLLRTVHQGGFYGDRRAVDLILQTINGIAAGVQTTG